MQKWRFFSDSIRGIFRYLGIDDGFFHLISELAISFFPIDGKFKEGTTKKKELTGHILY